MLKQLQSRFYWEIPLKSHYFSLFWCVPCTATPDILSLSENINSTTSVSRLSFRLLWLWFQEHLLSKHSNIDFSKEKEKDASSMRTGNLQLSPIKKRFLARYVPTLKALNQEHIILADLTIPIGKKFKNNWVQGFVKIES